jgi:hypothetical protein
MSDAKRKAAGPPAVDADTPRGSKRLKLAAVSAGARCWWLMAHCSFEIFVVVVLIVAGRVATKTTRCCGSFVARWRMEGGRSVDGQAWMVLFNAARGSTGNVRLEGSTGASLVDDYDYDSGEHRQRWSSNSCGDDDWMADASGALCRELWTSRTRRRRRQRRRAMTFCGR